MTREGERVGKKRWGGEGEGEWWMRELEKERKVQDDQWECVESKRLYIPSSISVTVLPTRVRYLRPVNFI